VEGFMLETRLKDEIDGRVGSFQAFGRDACGPGLHPTFAFGAGWRRLKANEPIYVDYGAVYSGYITDATRVFVVGQLSPWLARAHRKRHPAAHQFSGQGLLAFLQALGN